MRHWAILFASALCFLPATPASAADRYTLDPARSEIRFSIRNLGIGRVYGKFTEFSGALLYDERDASRSSATAAVQTVSIDTRIRRRDEHLRSPAFLDTAAYPEMAFQSTRVEMNGPEGVCVGTLTLHGVSKEVRIPFKISQGDRLSIQADFALNRRDFGISYNALIGNEVTVALRLEAIPEH